MVDFFEVLVDIAGARSKAWMCLLRLMHSGDELAWLYPRQDQVRFLDGHVPAFTHLGGVPQRLLYDNLKPAVARVLVRSERQLTARFEALATHYMFEPCSARPATRHDKGGVEVGAILPFTSTTGWSFNQIVRRPTKGGRPWQAKGTRG